jgi:hypothetical protein
MPAEVRDRALGVGQGQVCKHLLAHDQVVAAFDLIRDAGLPAVLTNPRRNASDGVGREIEAEPLDAAIPECLDEQPHGTTRVEHAARPYAGHDVVGDTAEERRPVCVAPVRPATVVEVIILTEITLVHVLASARQRS